MKPTSTRSPKPGLTVGCAPGLYCRNDSVNRAQMAAFLARALDLPAATKDYFNDDNSFSLEPEINAAAQAGLTGGCGDNRYCPAAAVTREQMAAFILRAFKPD